MSTDHQRYSIENQKQVIAEYAFLHDFEVVQTYADEGKSGVHIKHRDALKRLLSDVQNGHADFEVVLVYDVSRWGRFQDADESAYYEFTCKAAGISVVYCAELFENNGSALTALIKVMKRVMAGEYSRELSVKISRAHQFHAKRGFHQGGTRNYGLHRLLVDDSRRPKVILRDGQAKSFHGDRVILTPGPEDEIAIVQKIFRMYAVEKMSQREIVRTLNKKGIRNRRGNRWSASNMSKMLANEKYGGTFVYCQSQWPLTGGRIPIPSQQWIRVEGAIEPIVSQDVFEAAQRRLREGRKWTDTDLLNYLTAAWCTAGYLSIPRVNRDKVCPTAPTYRDHFGHITDAYRLIGYKQVHVYRYSKIGGDMRRVHRNILCQLTSASKREVITFDEEKQVLVINGRLTVAVVVLPFLSPHRNPQPGWKLYFDRLAKCDAIFIVRMDTTNAELLDFYLVPRIIFQQPSYRFTEDRMKQFKTYKLRSVSTFDRALRRMCDTNAGLVKSPPLK
jgi:DNA invertase Pin-like site-specific DNA recombinase